MLKRGKADAFSTGNPFGRFREQCRHVKARAGETDGFFGARANVSVSLYLMRTRAGLRLWTRSGAPTLVAAIIALGCLNSKRATGDGIVAGKEFNQLTKKLLVVTSGLCLGCAP